MKLTNEQRSSLLKEFTGHDISYDPYEWIDTLNYTLKVLGYDEKIIHDDYDNPHWLDGKEKNDNLS